MNTLYSFTGTINECRAYALAISHLYTGYAKTRIRGRGPRKPHVGKLDSSGKPYHHSTLRNELPLRFATHGVVYVIMPGGETRNFSDGKPTRIRKST